MKDTNFDLISDKFYITSNLSKTAFNHTNFVLEMSSVYLREISQIAAALLQFMELVTLTRLTFKGDFLVLVTTEDLNKIIEILTREINFKNVELILRNSGGLGILDLERSDLIDKYAFDSNGPRVKFKPEFAAKYFSVRMQPIQNTALTIVLKTTGDAPIYWDQFETSESNFLPTVYRVQSAQARIMYGYISTNYIRKENSCTAGNIGVLKINAEVNRIEYGTISAQNQMVMHELDIEVRT